MLWDNIIWLLKDGALAQLGERKVRNLEARGSIPLCSTNLNRSDAVFLLIENHAIVAWFSILLLS